MSLFALKILPVCPSTLLDKTFMSLFSAENGILIADLSTNISDLHYSWKGEAFSSSERERLREIIAFLRGRNAILDYQAHGDFKAAEPFEKICLELRNPKRHIECGITGDEPPILPDDLSSLFFSKTDFLAKGKHLHKHLKVNRTPSELAEIMTPYVFQSSYFKLIDPYMFEMSEHNVAKRLDFLVETCNQIKQHNNLPTQEIKIEVIGRSYFFSKRKRFDIRPYQLKKILAHDNRLRDLSEEFRIQFIGLDDRITNYEEYVDAEPNEKIHKRFFYTDKYLISLEYPFETKENDQNIVWFGQEYRRYEIARDYRENSESFKKSFSFNATQAWT